MLRVIASHSWIPAGRGGWPEVQWCDACWPGKELSSGWCGAVSWACPPPPPPPPAWSPRPGGWCSSCECHCWGPLSVQFITMTGDIWKRMRLFPVVTKSVSLQLKGSILTKEHYTAHSPPPATLSLRSWLERSLVMTVLMTVSGPMRGPHYSSCVWYPALLL